MGRTKITITETENNSRKYTMINRKVNSVVDVDKQTHMKARCKAWNARRKERALLCDVYEAENAALKEDLNNAKMHRHFSEAHIASIEKANKELMEENERLKAENERLKAENNGLRIENSELSVNCRSLTPSFMTELLVQSPLESELDPVRLFSD